MYVEAFSLVLTNLLGVLSLGETSISKCGLMKASKWSKSKSDPESLLSVYNSSIISSFSYS